MKHYLLSATEIQPILWDRKTPFTVPEGVRLLTEDEFKAWSESPDGQNLPAGYDPQTDRVELDVKTLKYVKRKATAEELKEADARNERNQVRALLTNLKAGNASNAQVQRVLAHLLEKLL